MKTVLYRGPILTASGYAVHGRQIATYLLKKEQEGKCKVYFDILPWGNTHWFLDRNDLNGLVGKVLDRSNYEDVLKNNTEKFDITFQLQLPNEWEPKLGKYNVGITAAVETDICNPKWIEQCNQMNQIIVPSEHTKTTLTNSGFILVPLDVVPESFIDEILLPKEQLPINTFNFSTEFNFLLVGQITGNSSETDRKNIYNTIKWFCELFANNKDVGLVIKTNFVKNSKIDRMFTENIMLKMLRECRGNSQFPKVHLVHGLLSDKEMAALYYNPKIKCLLSISCGEGWNIPALEASAAGLPVIATNWSGHLDFLNKGKFIKISYNLEPVPQQRIDNNIFINNSKWARPVELDAKAKLKKFKESPSVPQQWAKELSEIIKKEYTLSSIHSKYDKVVGELF